jgi:hypothetical protein
VPLRVLPLLVLPLLLLRVLRLPMLISSSDELSRLLLLDFRPLRLFFCGSLWRETSK